MKEISLNKGKVAIIDDEMYEKLSKMKWHVEDNKNCSTCYAINSKYERMHRLIMEARKDQMIDHKNNNGLDNRKENLRFCSNGQNIANRPKTKRNTSGFKGIYKLTRKYKGREYTYWKAQISVNSVTKYIGLFSKKEDAAKKYNEYALKQYGEFAQLNNSL